MSAELTPMCRPIQLILIWKNNNTPPILPAIRLQQLAAKKVNNLQIALPNVKEKQAKRSRVKQAARLIKIKGSQCIPQCISLKRQQSQSNLNSLWIITSISIFLLQMLNLGNHSDLFTHHLLRHLLLINLEISSKISIKKEKMNNITSRMPEFSSASKLW